MRLEEDHSESFASGQRVDAQHVEDEEVLPATVRIRAGWLERCGWSGCGGRGGRGPARGVEGRTCRTETSPAA